MIKINEKLKDTSEGYELNEKNFPMLFEPSEEYIGEYEQVRDFALTYDKDFNLIIETTLSDGEEIRVRILEYLSKRKPLVLQGIEIFNKELSAINEILGE